MTWETKPLASLVDILDGRRIPVKASDRAQRQGTVPYYGATGQAGWIDEPIFDEPLVLLGEDGAPFFDPHKPKAYFIDGPSWVNNHAHVLRATHIDRRFLKYFLDSFHYEGYANGTTRLKLTQAAMKRITVPVPELGEQRRIVELVEEHLSHLDAADATLRKSRRSADALLDCWLASKITTAWPARRLADLVLDSRTGLNRTSKDWIAEGGRPYVRMQNITRRGTWNLTEIPQVAISSSEVEKQTLLPGDFLFNTRNSPDLVGKSAVATADMAGWTYNLNLLRIRWTSELDPNFARIQFMAPPMAGQLRNAISGTTSVAAIYQRDLMAMTIGLPGIQEQEEIVRDFQTLEDNLARGEESIEFGRLRTAALRRAVLAAAFSGRLTGRVSDADIIEETAESLA